LREKGVEQVFEELWTRSFEVLYPVSGTCSFSQLIF